MLFVVENMSIQTIILSKHPSSLTNNRIAIAIATAIPIPIAITNKGKHINIVSHTAIRARYSKIFEFKIAFSLIRVVDRYYGT